MTIRSSGILCHVTSLPSPYGIGDFGDGSFRFVDFLVDTAQTYWQVLPFSPTDPITGNSPYSSSSAFAGNIDLISPQRLMEDGLLSKRDVAEVPFFPEGRVIYPDVRIYKLGLLEKAFKTHTKDRLLQNEFDVFLEEQRFWVNDFALFAVINDQLSHVVWNQWPEGLKTRDKKVVSEFEKTFAGDIERIKFWQFLFYRQWQKLHAYCREKSVRVIGDLPIYVSLDSADVWTMPQNYKLKDNFDPEFVAGVPPDYFSETGQRWGNPVYKWDVIKENGFVWWKERIKHQAKLFDMIRIDHFRGLVQYWEIPADELTAQKGTWKDVPTDDLINAIQAAGGGLSIIAEDLGIITDDVHDVMNRYQFPGMKVLLFAFNGDMDTHPYLPHNFNENSVVYTGTHDNNTVCGWYKDEASREEKINLAHYINKDLSEQSVHWDMIELAVSSKAMLSIIPLQDAMGLGSSARMNKPATVEGNWSWRALNGSFTEECRKRLYDLTCQYGRNAPAMSGKSLEPS